MLERSSRGAAVSIDAWADCSSQARKRQNPKAGRESTNGIGGFRAFRVFVVLFFA
jgi:hypothetical protein